MQKKATHIASDGGRFYKKRGGTKPSADIETQIAREEQKRSVQEKKDLLAQEE